MIQLSTCLKEVLGVLVGQYIQRKKRKTVTVKIELKTPHPLTIGNRIEAAFIIRSTSISEKPERAACALLSALPKKVHQTLPFPGILSRHTLYHVLPTRYLSTLVKTAV